MYLAQTILTIWYAIVFFIGLYTRIPEGLTEEEENYEASKLIIPPIVIILLINVAALLYYIF